MTATKPERKATCFRLWVLLVLLMLGFSGLVWQLRLPTVAYLALAYFPYCFVVIAIAFFGTLILVRNSVGTRRFSLRQLFGAFLLIGFILGAVLIARQHQPVRHCFRASQSAFDTLADRIAATPSTGIHQVNEKIGHYHITTAYMANDAVILRLDSHETPFFYYGFIRIPQHSGRAVDGKKYGLPESRFDHMRGDWYVFYSYYWSVKTGWS